MRPTHARVNLNAAGLAFLNGPELAVALDLENADVGTSSGPGFGIYVAATCSATSLPKIGVGLGLEWLRPPRVDLVPDPGEPVRLTLSHANAIGSHLSLGLNFHYFINGGPLDGLATFDIGLAGRINNYVAFGGNIRDLDTRDRRATGAAPLRARGVGSPVRHRRARGLGRWADRRDPRRRRRLGRASACVRSGAYVVGAVESRALHAIDDSPAGTTDLDLRELRATVGLELSFGGVGLAAYGTGLRAPQGGGNHALGTTLVATFSGAPRPSVLPPSEHLERVELTGDIEARELTPSCCGCARSRAITA